jgi:hypothetical protein
MSRRAARITHDEVCRMVKAAASCGLPIGRVVFDGTTLSVVISGDNGKNHQSRLAKMGRWCRCYGSLSFDCSGNGSETRTRHDQDKQ